MYIAIAEVCKHIHKKQKKKINCFVIFWFNFQNVSRTSTKKKMKHSGRPFSEDYDVEEVIVLFDCEEGISAKEEKRNRNKERERCLS